MDLVRSPPSGLLKAAKEALDDVGDFLNRQLLEERG